MIIDFVEQDDLPRDWPDKELQLVPRNPSELARLEDEYEYWAAKVLSNTTPKGDKEKALVELNKVAKQLGIKIGNYNNTEFTSSLSKRQV